MKTKSYILAHYKIFENIDGTLWWESYAGFARTQSAKCFIEGNVLFLEPAIVVSDPGFLIMAYTETLDALPHWTKTPYSCINYTLKPCKTTKISPEKQYGRPFRERFKYVRDSISTDRKAQGKKTFKKTAEIITGVTKYKNWFLKRINK